MVLLMHITASRFGARFGETVVIVDTGVVVDNPEEITLRSLLQDTLGADENVMNDENIYELTTASGTNLKALIDIPISDMLSMFDDKPKRIVVKLLDVSPHHTKNVAVAADSDSGNPIDFIRCVFWSKLVQVVCCNRKSDKRVKDDGEWMEPILPKSKAPTVSISDPMDDTETSAVPSGVGGSPPSCVKWDRWSEVQNVVVKKRPSAAGVRWSDLAKNFDKMNVADLELHDNSEHDDEVVAAVNMISPHPQDRSMAKSLGDMSMRGLFPDDSVSRGLGGFSSCFQGEAENGDSIDENEGNSVKRSTVMRDMMGYTIE